MLLIGAAFCKIKQNDSYEPIHVSGQHAHVNAM